MTPTSIRIGSLALFLSILTPIGPTAADAAFHDGGVGSCQGCHVMHATEDGQWIPSEEQLLRGDSASDTCLLCHSDGPGAVFGGSVLAPTPHLGGGNFVFLLEDQINDAHNGAMHPLAGEAAGHSIVAPGEGLSPDSRWSVAPGGSFPSSLLGCTSCHDPHGNTNYRMLHGAGPVQGGLFTFTAGAPKGEGIALDDPTPAESRTRHTAYISGWTQWCGNCHGDRYHGESSGPGFEHPVDEWLDQEIVSRYNAYLGDADPTGGDRSTAYLPEVPFEDSSATTGSTQGPSSWSRMSCVTCHRAHASSGPAAGRWDFRVETLGDDGVVSGSWPIPNPYVDPAQRQLCVKCHDTGGHDNQKSCLQCHGHGGN